MTDISPSEIWQCYSLHSWFLRENLYTSKQHGLLRPSQVYPAQYEMTLEISEFEKPKQGTDHHLRMYDVAH